MSKPKRTTVSVNWFENLELVWRNSHLFSILCYVSC